MSAPKIPPPAKPWKAKEVKLAYAEPGKMTKKQKTEGKVSKRSDQKTNLQKMLGGHGTDTRTPSNTVEGLAKVLELETISKVMDVVATVQDKTIRNLSLGIVLRALKAGLSSNTKGAATNPYFMYRYLTDAFISSMKGTIPALQQAPRWFWEVCYSLKPKQTNFKTSEVKYAWTFLASGADDSSPIPMQIAGLAYSVCLTQSLIPGNVLGFPLLAPQPTLSYNPDIGATAISNLWSYVKGSTFMTQLVGDPGEDAYTAEDTSAFSVVFPEIGASYWSPGAYRTTLYSERQIDMPIFAKFAEYQESGTTDWRGWHKASAGAGSATYIGPRVSEMISPAVLRNKVIPVIKAYNFDEYYEVLCLTLAQACSGKLHNQGTPVNPCPLSPIEAQILLRQTIIPLFSNEMCQDIYLQGASTEDLLPFSVGQNGVSQGTNMLIPTGLAECIRCCKRSLHQLNGKGKGCREIDYVPVLCRPPGKNQLGNYQVDQQTFPLLFAGSHPDNLVNLVDMSSIQSSTVVYLDVTRAKLGDLTAIWNEWILTLSTNLSPLVTIGQADGISILKTHSYTNFEGQILPTVQQLPPPVPQMTKQNSHTKLIDVKGTERKQVTALGPAPGTGYFETMSDVQTSSTLTVFAPVWKVLAMWILPVTIANPSALDEQSRQGWKAFYVEPYTVPRSNAGGLSTTTEVNAPPSVYTRHVEMASVDVKSIASDGQNEIIQFLMEAGKQGRGGLLETIAEMAGPVVKMAGNIFGF